jgi:hypothetical protein
MITIINERKGYKEEFKNYQKLCNHIGRNQIGKRSNTPNHLIDDWFFACHSHRRVMAFYEFVSTQKINAAKRSGGKSPKFDILEMSYDRSIIPVIKLITPDLDVESLLADWCQRYCAFYGYKLVEVQDDGGMLHVKRNPHQPSSGEDGS